MAPCFPGNATVSSPGRDSTIGAPPRARPEGPQRFIRDEAGLLWHVREIQFADVTPSLVFETTGIFRRVRRYPANWYELSDAELYALSWKT